ncbi:Golgi phosphoprotein 3-domain-containing protein [Dissophora ornata]|nr:Golgi phosphoprotein 3-domain-containing protein [Dissophora ornata]
MMSSTGGLSRRRGGGGGGGGGDEDYTSPPNTSGPTGLNRNTSLHRHCSTDANVASDPRDLQMEDENKTQPKLTLMEEVLLLGLKDKQGYLSFWNDNISYTLRGCILMELAFRNRIAMVKDPNRRKYPLADRYIEVVSEKLTGEVLLDEALKMINSTQERMSVGQWIDLMSGETWNVMKIGFQLKQVRERLAKGLVDKGVLRTEKRNFLIFDMATHPVTDSAVKEEVVKRACTMLISRNDGSTPSLTEQDSPVAFQQLRTVSMVCAAYAANVLENALMYLNHEMRERAYTKVDELLNDYSQFPFGSSASKSEIVGRELQMEVVAAVLNVFTKMDSIL